MRTEFFQFIKRIQYSDQATKKRWVVIFSALSMFFVIGIWSFQLNSTIRSLTQRPAENPLVVTATTDQSSFWDTFKIGLGVVGTQLGASTSRLFATINSYFHTSTSVNVQTASFNFIVQNLPTITPKTFPN